MPPSFEPIADIVFDVVPGICDNEIEYPKLVNSHNCNVTLEQLEGIGANGMFPLSVTNETWAVSDAG